MYRGQKINKKDNVAVDTESTYGINCRTLIPVTDPLQRICKSYEEDIPFSVSCLKKVKIRIYKTIILPIVLYGLSP
jgi:hypothetical protein